MTDIESLDPYIPPAVRKWIEQRYYARINAQAQMEALVDDVEFLRDPERSVALWPDHGVVHVRDVTHQIITVIDNVLGVLIPARNAQRTAFMKAYAAAVAYVHDIGMMDFSRVGRAVHPEFATQAVLSAEFDDVIDAIWEAGCGGVASTLARMTEQGTLTQNPPTVLREMMAMANCHSKSKVPVSVLNDPPALRKAMIAATHANLPGNAGIPPAMGNAGILPAFADRPPPMPFQWLLGRSSENFDLIDDVVDTLRALRCADALRQRGTVLKTSGNYEIFVDQNTGNAICALRYGNDELILLELTDKISAGEANIAGSELGRDGNLRISFHRGAFPTHAIVASAAHSAAIAVNDIQLDVIESFRRPHDRGRAANDGLKSFEDIRIQLEGVDDNMAFAHIVMQQLIALNPSLSERIQVVPSLQSAAPRELQRYLAAGDLHWDLDQRRTLLERIAQTGHKTTAMDPLLAFEHSRMAQLRAGERLIDAGAPASFVYIPLGDGLKVIPLGGYPPFSVRAWMPLGNTGVIRGAMRNASVVAEQDVATLIIPKEVFLNHWHHPYTPAEFRQELARRASVS